MTYITRKEKRYIDLMGDPIEASRLGKTLKSDDFVLGGGAAFCFNLASGMDSTEALATALGYTLTDIALYRLFHERVWHRKFSGSFNLFLSQDTLKSKAIDKFPEEEQVINSIYKYSEAAENVVFGMRLLAGINIIGSSLACLASTANDNGISVLLSYIGKNSGEATRIAQTYHRFAKIRDGDWAIVDMPDGQDVVERDLFKLPSFGSSPDAAPAPQGA